MSDIREEESDEEARRSKMNARVQSPNVDKSEGDKEVAKGGVLLLPVGPNGGAQEFVRVTRTPPRAHLSRRRGACAELD